MRPLQDAGGSAKVEGAAATHRSASGEDSSGCPAIYVLRATRKQASDFLPAGRRVDDGANAESAFADGAPEQVDLREDMKLQPDFHVVFAADVARQTDAQDVGHVTGCQHGLDLGLGRVIQCGMFVLHALQ